MIDTQPLLVDIAGAQRLLSLGESSTREVVKHMRVVRFGRKVLVPFAELERWVNENTSDIEAIAEAV